MDILTLPLGPLQTNCYVIIDDNKECIIIDPGNSIIDPGNHGEELVGFIEKCGLKPLAILLTHAHFDHIGAIDDVVEKWDIPVYVHHDELPSLKDPQINGSRQFHMPDVVVETIPHHISREGELIISDFSFKVFSTPGHSPGGLAFYMEEENAVFSGDVLFQMGIGRSDLPKGDFETLRNSILEKLYMLPDETIVYPGHGNPTTILNEKKENPFVPGIK